MTLPVPHLPLWGAPRIHGELLKLGINISQRTIGRLMPKHREPPSQTWRTFLENHASDSAALDFFTVPTVRFRVLFVLVVLRHDRRRVVHINVTEHPSPVALPPLAREGHARWAPAQPAEPGVVVEFPEAGGLHHHYERRAA